MKLIRVDSIYREVSLSKGCVAVVDAADYEKVVEAGPWFALPSGKTVYAVASRKVGGRWTTLRLHQLLFPGHEVVDHWNGHGWDNRRVNLRPTTIQMNNANKRLRKDNVSGFKGVSWEAASSRWAAFIKVDRRSRRIGAYLTKEEAALAYDKAAREAFGEFARFNFPVPGERSALV